MEDLQELVMVFKARGLQKHVQIAGEKKRKLYNGLVKGKYKTENDAIVDIYGSLVAKGRFAVLKTDLKKSLLNTLLLIDPKYYSPRIKAILSAYRNLYLYNILYCLSAINIGRTFGKKALNEFEDLHIAHLQLPILHERTRRAGFYGTSKQLASEFQKLEDKVNIYSAEIKMEYLYLSLLDTVGSITRSPKLIPKAKQNYLEARKLRKRFRSYTLDYNFYSVCLMYFEYTCQYKEMGKASDEAIKTLMSYPNEKIDRDIFLVRFLTAKTLAFLYIQDYKSAEKVINECNKLITIGANWYSAIAYEFHVYTHSLQFSKAKEIVDKAISADQFKFQDQRRRDQWNIYAICLDLVESINNPQLVNPQYLDIKNIEKKIAFFTKDRVGIKALVNIVHILFLLLYGRYDLINSRTEMIKTQYQRYVKTASPSLGLLLKLILLIERKSFSYDKVILEAKRLKAKYKSFGITPTELNEGIAILPYDWLFDKTLEILKRNNEEDAAKGRRLR